MKPNKKVIINMLTSSESCNLIHNGNQTYWNPIWSIIIRVINKWTTAKQESNCWSQVWLQTELDDMKSWHQLIKTMTKFEKETNKKTTVNSAKCATKDGTHDTYYCLTQAWRKLFYCSVQLQVWCLQRSNWAGDNQSPSRIFFLVLINIINVQISQTLSSFKTCYKKDLLSKFVENN